MHNIDWKEVEAFFYHAMATSGYPAGARFAGPALLRGHTRIGHQRADGMFRLEDIWSHGPGTKSAGFTTIYLYTGDEARVDWMPIWQMHYGGEYQKEHTSVLKKILLDAYSRPEGGKFQGCRGPREIVHDGILYTNRLESPLVHEEASFCKFSGFERMVSHFSDRSKVGYHQYFGMALV